MQYPHTVYISIYNTHILSIILYKSHIILSIIMYKTHIL